MSWIIGYLLVSAAVAMTPPRTTVIGVVTIAPPGRSLGQPNRLSLINRRIGARDVRILQSEGVTPTKRVIPKSLAHQIETEMNQWRRRLAKVPGGAQSVDCAHGVAIDRGPRAVPLCLDRAPEKLRQDFLAWYRRTGAWLE